MLHANAKHPNCAYKWLEWQLTPKVQGDVAAWFGSVPAVPAACENHALLGPQGCRTNGIGNFEKIHFWRTPEASCRRRERAFPTAAGPRTTLIPTVLAYYLSRPAEERT